MIQPRFGIPSPEFNFFTVGPFEIRFYALFILLGIVLATSIAAFRLKSRGVEPGVALDVAIWAVPLGIVGARAYHVATHLSDYFGAGKNPLSALFVWEGGIAIYGGLIGGALGAWIAAKQARVSFLGLADAFAPGILLAQGIGRWGNYFNGELFGVPTTLPWGLEVPSYNPAYPVGLPDGVLFHPTFLYESIWNFLGVFVLLYLERKFELRWGKLFAAYMIYYSVGRAFIESIRIDPSMIFLGVRTNVWAAILGVLLGVVLFVWLRRKHPGKQISLYLGPKPEEISDATSKPKSKKLVVAEAKTKKVKKDETVYHGE